MSEPTNFFRGFRRGFISGNLIVLPILTFLALYAGHWVMAALAMVLWFGSVYVAKKEQW